MFAQKHKQIAARKQCSLQEVVYWYNVTPEDSLHSETTPVNVVYSYKVQVKGVDNIATEAQEIYKN